MPAFYTIDKDKKLVLTSATGVMTVDDVRNHRKQLVNDKDFDPSFSQLIDFTGVTVLALAADDVWSLSHVDLFSFQSHRALIAPTDMIYGMARMFELLRETYGQDKIRVFRERNAALDWLAHGEAPR